MKKIRVAVIYGGKSGEHEVSLQSAASVLQNLDRNRYEIVPVSINKQGQWQWNDLQLIQNQKTLPIFKDAPEMRLAPEGGGKASLIPLSVNRPSIANIDVVFPVMHGPLCEDGSIQGMLELAEVAYVGSGVLGSAIGMDKDVAKRLAAAAGVPVAPYCCFKKGQASPQAMRAESEKLRLPVFVKPANMGSSVGVQKVKNWHDLLPAIETAFQYDTKVLVETGIDAREIELAVLETEKEPFISVPSEVRAKGNHEFYSYEAKYLDADGADLDLPAKLEPAQVRFATEMARKIFIALECEGMARVDLFLDRKSNEFFFNEVNTIPGFTTISMYPKMMAASGIQYTELLDRLIQLALRKQKLKQELKRDFS